MPCIRSRLAASLAGDLLADGALLLRGYSDFGSQPGCDLQIDTRKPDGLVAFYRRAAAATSRIDFCIHCLEIERGTNAEEKQRNRLDARTIFMGTLLALRQLKRQQGSGTILNVALTESIESTDAAMILAAQDLVVGVTHYAATVAPGKVRAFAFLPDSGPPGTLICSGPDFEVREVCLSDTEISRLSQTLLQFVRLVL
jgi:NAD(P)-dependent dehydrogenase (short-subunit alcohol dehydrogenase family)